MPKEVQDTLLKLSSPKYYFKENSDLICFDGKYSLELEMVGPWISSETIIDEVRGIKYKIDTATPSPIIIYHNKLFVPNEYNVLFEGKINKTMFTRYLLLDLFFVWTNRLIFYTLISFVVFLFIRFSDKRNLVK